MRPHEPILSLFISWYSTFVYPLLFLCEFPERDIHSRFYDIRSNFECMYVYWAWTIGHINFRFKVHMRTQACRSMVKRFGRFECNHFQFARSLNFYCSEVKTFVSGQNLHTVNRFDYSFFAKSDQFRPISIFHPMDEFVNYLNEFYSRVSVFTTCGHIEFYWAISHFGEFGWQYSAFPIANIQNIYRWLH